ncbi:hypothetical protein EMCRGX_G028474 [Ephydatia muelleri]
MVLDTLSNLGSEEAVLLITVEKVGGKTDSKDASCRNRILHVMKALVIQKLRSLEISGMIARVEEPTEWISSCLESGKTKWKKIWNQEVFQLERESVCAEVVAKELKEELSVLIRPYWNFRDTMVVQDGIVYKGSQVVVAKSLRNDYLKLFHPSHMGSESTLRRARDAVYWPHMAEDIKRITFECRHCEEDAPAQTKEPQSAHMVPKHPWSKWCTQMVVPSLFQAFSKAWEFVHTPYHSQSNGKVESAIKIVQRLFKQSSDPYMALLEWRNTPTVGLDFSPCQRLLRSTNSRSCSGECMEIGSSPTAEDVGPLQKMWEKKVDRQRTIQAQAKGKGKTLEPLKMGDPVLVVQDLQSKKTEWMQGYCRVKASNNHPLDLELSAHDVKPAESEEERVQRSGTDSSSEVEQTQPTTMAIQEVKVNSQSGSEDLSTRK